MIVLLGAVLAAAMFCAMLAAACLLNGWVFSVVWGWFFVPLGMPALSITAAMGVALVVGFLTHQYVPSKKGNGGEAFAYLVLHPLLTLFIGWCIKQAAGA